MLALLPGILVLVLPLSLFYWMRGRHHVELARAQRWTPEHLERLSLNLSPNLSQRWPASLPASRAVEVEAEANAPIAVPTFAQMFANGQIGKEQPLVLGWGGAGPLLGSWDDLYTSFICGLPGGGKTTTTRYLLGLSAAIGSKFAVIDPHGHAAEHAGCETLAKTIQPLRSALIGDIAIEPPDILQTVRLVAGELEARKQGTPYSFPLLLVLEEFSALMRNAALARELRGLLESIASEGRKFQIYAALLGQQAHASRTGGGELRSVISSVYLHRMRPDVARMITGLPSRDIPDVLRLQPGEAYLLRTSGELARIRIPNTTSHDLEHIGARLSGATPPVARYVAPATTPPSAPVAVSGDERRQILDAFERLSAPGRKPSRRKVCAAVFGAERGYGFVKVKAVLDGEGL